MKKSVFNIIAAAFVAAAMSGCGGGQPPATAAVVAVAETLQDIVDREDLTGVVATKLPLVYKRDNEFYVLPGYDPARKDEFWGFALKNGTFIERAYGSQPIRYKNWYYTKTFAEGMTYKGKKGSLPSLDRIEETWGRAERQAMEATVATLATKGVKAEAYGDDQIIWASDEMDNHYVYYFFLKTGDYSYYGKSGEPHNTKRRPDPSGLILLGVRITVAF